MGLVSITAWRLSSPANLSSSGLRPQAAHTTHALWPLFAAVSGRLSRGPACAGVVRRLFRLGTSVEQRLMLLLVAANGWQSSLLKIAVQFRTGIKNPPH